MIDPPLDEDDSEQIISLAIAALVRARRAEAVAGAPGTLIIDGAALEVGCSADGSVLACCKVIDGVPSAAVRRSGLGASATMLSMMNACMALVNDRLCVIARWVCPPESPVEDLAEWISLLADCRPSLTRLLSGPDVPTSKAVEPIGDSVGGSKSVDALNSEHR